MEDNKNISVINKGMLKDLNILNTDSTVYTFALNAITEDFSDGNTPNIQNEGSNKCSVEFPPNYQVVGYVEIIEQNRTIYFLKNPISGVSQIGEVLNCELSSGTDKIKNSNCDNCEKVGEELLPLEQQLVNNCSCQYTIVVNDCSEEDGCLNFDVNYPIDIEYKITNCTLNLYFTDNINERRFIYFDYLNNDINKPLILQDRFKKQIGVSENCETPIYSNCIDCEKIKYHPTYTRPCIEFLDFVNGGNLKAGDYQILVAYSDVYSNPISNYFPSTHVVPLFEEEITFETNYQTNKAIHFKINNLKNNSVFQYYNIVIAQTIDQFTEFFMVGTFSTTQKNYVYTGFEKTIKRLSPTEVFFKRPFYKTAKGVTKANNYLFFTGVKEYNILNLQPVANKIKLQWKTVALKENSYRDPKNVFYFKTYHRDEVYAFAIIFEMSNGRETCAFHIPGRESTVYDREPICLPNNDIIEEVYCQDIEYCTNADVVLDIPQGGDTPISTCKPRWQVYNTGNIQATPHEYNIDCVENSCWEYGDFAYWESIEKYPNVSEIWGDLCGKCIRHHKFPDSCITHIHDGNNDKKVFADNNYIYPIGVYVDHSSVINALNDSVNAGLISIKDKQDIIGYRIVRGNRVGNKSVEAKGLIYNMFNYVKDLQTYYFSNYPYNDLNQDSFIHDVNLDNPTNRFTFHSPDIHFVNSSLGNILKIETEEYGESEGYFTLSECQAKHKFLSVFAQTLAFGLGLAAAISATGEKTCKVITYKSDVETNAFTTTTSGNTPVGIVTGSSPGATTTTVSNSSFNASTDVPKITQINDTRDIGTYDGDDGSDVASAKKGSEEQITTCKGQSHQIFNDSTFLGGIFGGLASGASKLLQRTMLGILEMDKILETLETLIPEKNYSTQYNSVGKYNNYKCVAESNKVRKIEKYAYLNSNIQSIDEPNTTGTNLNTIKINNWNREDSVYLKLNESLSNPTVLDDSKVPMNMFGDNAMDALNKVFNRTISSYYVSIKNNILNQYGQLCNIEYLETNSCTFELDKGYNISNTNIFGGDIFINRFALKRKMSFFTHTMCNLPNNSDVLYSELSNVGTPKYFFNTKEPLLNRFTNYVDSGNPIIDALGVFPSITLGVINSVSGNTADLSLVNSNRHVFDVRKNELFWQNGYVPLFNYGIPYFLVESDINVDYRHGQNNKDKDFYPHNKDLKNWLEEDNVPITTPNYYFYNRTYSKQNKESSICRSCILDINDLKCQSINYNRLIYSEVTDTENKNDNWLVFKANNFYDFPLTLGKLITADGIENDKILVRLEKGTQIFNAYNTIQSTEENIQVGTGGIFQTRPKDISVTDLGYAGTQHKAILHTEFGHIWVDAERGQVFNLNIGGEGIDELTKNGMKSWFKENLPFFLKKDFPNYITFDNNLNGIGLHYCFDKRFNRFLITKLDYKLLDKTVKYNEVLNKFYIYQDGQIKYIELINTKYFCNKSWTISYNFYTKSWVSFHSYIPLFYIEHIDTFESSIFKPKVINNQLGKIQKIYTHNYTNKSYQVFYGKLEPFIIEYQTKQDISNNLLYSIEYSVDFIRYHNEFDTFYNNKKTFNKCIIYNKYQTSGLLYFKVDNPNDLFTKLKYPKRVLDGYEILTSNSENLWRFNDFYNVVSNENSNIPMFNYNCNNVNMTLNTDALDYDKNSFNKSRLRDKMCKVRLIQDIESNYKIIFNFGINNQKSSLR